MDHSFKSFNLDKSVRLNTDVNCPNLNSYDVPFIYWLEPEPIKPLKSHSNYFFDSNLDDFMTIWI